MIMGSLYNRRMCLGHNSNEKAKIELATSMGILILWASSEH